jgi:signal peptidase I
MGYSINIIFLLSGPPLTNLSEPEELGAHGRFSPLRVILAVAAGFLLIQLFVLDVMKVEGHSMEPTLRSDQIIFVCRMSYGLLLPFSDRYLLRWGTPDAGEVVVLPSPLDGRLLVKRCGAVPGDDLHRQGAVLEVAATGTALVIDRESPLWDIHRVPERRYLVLSDSPSGSIDSRSFGLVREDGILGKVIGF